MTVLEAMITQTPVVGGRSSGNVPYLLDHGRAGALCDVRDPGDIARVVIDLLNDPARRLTLAATARQHAQACYSENAVITGIETYLRDVAHEGR